MQLAAGVSEGSGRWMFYWRLDARPWKQDVFERLRLAKPSAVVYLALRCIEYACGPWRSGAASGRLDPFNGRERRCWRSAGHDAGRRSTACLWE